MPPMKGGRIALSYLGSCLPSTGQPLRLLGPLPEQGGETAGVGSLEEPQDDEGIPDDDRSDAARWQDFWDAGPDAGDFDDDPLGLGGGLDESD